MSILVPVAKARLIHDSRAEDVPKVGDSSSLQIY